MSVSTQSRSTVRFRSGIAKTHVDRISVEAPLTLMLDGGVVVTTMRTPGNDIELTCGWLINESDVFNQGDIATIREFSGRTGDPGSVREGLEEIDTVRKLNAHLVVGWRHLLNRCAHTTVYDPLELTCRGWRRVRKAANSAP